MCSYAELAGECYRRGRRNNQIKVNTLAKPGDLKAITPPGLQWYPWGRIVGAATVRIATETAGEWSRREIECLKNLEEATSKL